MGNHHVAVESEQRSPTVSIRIHATLDGTKRFPRQISTRFTDWVLGQFPFEPIKNGGRQAFTSFQYDVPNKTVTHYDIHAIAEEIVSFDIPDKIQFNLFTKPKCFKSQFVSLDFFSPNVQ